ncbi:glycosyltransferase [Maribacter sp. 2304DJ31-5]|uniref:glycosyltransferase n=1 Tax=Maribacter sp. 2304DJ31-5 TaxID=3386273 RepID=UPI0039BC8799
MSQKKLLVIGLTWPEPNSTAAGHRMMQLLEAFMEAGYHITFSSAALETEFSVDLTLLGIQKQTIQLNSSTFDVFITDLHPDVVLFDRFLTEEQFGWRIAQYVPNALRILDTEDLHSLRYVREHAFKNGVSFTPETWLRNDRTKREMASIYRSDLSLIISSFEMELLQSEIKIDKSLLFHLPFMVGELPAIPDWSTYGERDDFIFIGGGKHAPNVDAIKYLKTEIWPLIRKQLPRTNLYIYGAYLPQQIVELHGPAEGFYIKGRIKDLKTVMQKARVCLAPLRYGAGIKGKLLQAMQFGTPSVTTTIGAEGMHDRLSWNGSIVDDPKEFAQAAVQLYSDKTSWEMAQKAGVPLINTIYSKIRLKKGLLNRINQLQNNLQEHRIQNFTGSMLQHQTLLSTKYMGKWIAEKNKKG